MSDAEREFFNHLVDCQAAAFAAMRALQLAKDRRMMPERLREIEAFLYERGPTSEDCSQLIGALEREWKAVNDALARLEGTLLG